MAEPETNSNALLSCTSTQSRMHSQNFAYSDPYNISSRTKLEDVTIKRHDQQSLSSQARELFGHRTIFEQQDEREWLLANVRSTTISIAVDKDAYQINGNYVLSDGKQFILILHGFAENENWTTWIKMVEPLAHRNRYSVIFVDLPGFGRSSGRDLHQASWKRHAPEIVVGILSSFGIRRPINVLATCGGAATIVRTINRYPLWFRDRTLLFTNSVIGEFGESRAGNFENILKQYNIHIVVHWFPDADHTHYCVAYKRWKKLRQDGFPYLQLIDFDPKTQTSLYEYPEVKVHNIGRCASKHEATVYWLSDDYIQRIIATLSRN